jgi:hypothetical protein
VAPREAEREEERDHDEPEDDDPVVGPDEEDEPLPALAA